MRCSCSSARSSGSGKRWPAPGRSTSRALADRSGVAERYVREWASAQAASGYLDYDRDGETFTLPPEQALAFADEDSPVYLLGGYHVISSVFKDRERIADGFAPAPVSAGTSTIRNCSSAPSSSFAPATAHTWCRHGCPRLEDAENKLRAGARVADVGCGHGASTLLMAQAYPASTFRGFDYHPASIERAAAKPARGNVAFEVASAADFPGRGYDLVCFFDCLHDMGDPVGALAHTREALADDGTVMLVEPFAADSLAANLNPVGRIYYAASTLICTPASVDQDVGLALGAQAGEQRLREVARQAGFSRFRRATETPFNLVLEARP